MIVLSEVSPHGWSELLTRRSSDSHHHPGDSATGGQVQLLHTMMYTSTSNEQALQKSTTRTRSW